MYCRGSRRRLRCSRLGNALLGLGLLREFGDNAVALAIKRNGTAGHDQHAVQAGENIGAVRDNEYSCTRLFKLL